MDNCHQEGLSLFTLPPSDTAFQSREWIEYRSSNQVTSNSVIDFNIPPQSSAYIDLKHSVLNVKLRLTQADGNPVNEDIVAGLINLPLHTIFRQVDLMFQQTPLSNIGSNYAYKSYIDTILKTNRATQENILTSQLFYKDNGENPDTTDAKTGPNSGLFNRFMSTTGGQIVDLEGPLFLDLFQQQRLLVNGVSIGLKLWPSLDAFRLMSDSLSPNEKVQIVDVRFKLCIQRSNNGVLVAHQKLFQNQPAVYPYLRSEIKTASIAPGQYGFSADDIFQGLVPSKLVVGLVSSAAYTGDYAKSPFNFQPFDCSSVGLYVDGQSYPAQPLQPNYGVNQFVDCYRTLTLFRKDINVSRDDYMYGYCLYVLDTDPYYTFNTKRRGHCRLELKFASPLPESATLIMYATFPEILHINQAREVYVK